MSASAANSNSEVLVMEYCVAVFNNILDWNGVNFLLDVNVYSWGFNDEWNFLLPCIFLKFKYGEFSDVCDFVWNLDLGSVWN